MPHLTTWVGAGVLAAGMSAAMLAGADAASADTGADNSKSSAGSSDRNDRPGPRRAGERTSAPAKATKTAKAGAAGAPVRVVRTKQVSVEAAAAVATPESATTTTEPVVAKPGFAKPVESRLRPAALTPTAAVTQAASLPDLIQSVVFDVLGVVVTIASGPPVVPPGSTVTVQSSTLNLAEGHTVPADWYYPAGDEPPERMILLQHGFLGVSAMYSWTAAYLAESTNSVVVVPTLSSNRFVQGGFWLGDDQVYRATANLFLGDRDALTTSALAAGYAQRYGADVALPDQFLLVGHSLGGGVVSGAAGYYADAIAASGAENHLAGVILLDAAPPGTTLPDALDKLAGLGTFTPVLELGAPKATPSRVDTALNADRPGNFNGVILANGMHLDSMQGGSWLIQFAAHVMYGAPSTPQNLSAAQTLIAGWANDMFTGQIDPATGTCHGADCVGSYGELGQNIEIATPDGPATGAVIGAFAAPATEFQPVSATTLVAAAPPTPSGLLFHV